MASIRYYRKSKRQPCYRLSYRDPRSGKWRQNLLHCTKDEAEAIRKQKDAEYTWYQVNPHLLDEKTLCSLAEAKKHFLAAKLHTIEYSTYKRYEGVFKSFENYTGHILLSEVTTTLMNEYTAAMLAERKTAGVNLDLRHLKAFMRFCRSENMIASVPKITMIKEKKRPVYFITREQFKKFLKCCEMLGEDAELVRDLTTLILLTAARVNEVLAVEWQQIDLDGGVIRLYDHVQENITDKTNSGGEQLCP